MTNVRNLTQHVVVLVQGSQTVHLPPAAEPPRVAETSVRQKFLNVGQLNLPLHEIRMGVVARLPEPEPDVVFLVPRLVAAACPERADLVVPYDEVRDAGGRVVGCRALARLLPAER